MTKNLYDEKPYDKSFEAEVVSCQEKDERFEIELNQTLFFPEQGGQTSDVGTINGIKVTDVQIIDGRIIHYCEEAIAIGQKVEGLIDWNHRFNNMQQHTGEHIFTGLAHKTLGADNVGFHLSDNTVTLDLNVELSAQQVAKLELEANQVIANDVKVKCWYPKKEDLDAISYRSKKEIAGDTRLVEIDGIDICACCAPHVATTGQVGMLKVVSFGKYKGGTRVFILCGLRALADFNRRQRILERTYQLLNCQEDEIPQKVEQIIADNKNVKGQISEIKTKQLLEQIQQYPSELQDVIIFTDGLEIKNMRDGVNALVSKHSGLCAVFSGDDESGYSFVIGSATRDCNAIAAGMRELLGAKGGGSKQMAQGSVMATRSEIERTII